MSVLRRVSLTLPAAVCAVALGTSGVAAASPFTSASADSGSLGSAEGSFGSLMPGGAAPKNIIYIVGDGMGFNHVAMTNVFESGQSRYTVEGDADPGTLTEADGDAVQIYESEAWTQLAASTFPEGSGYDGQAAWSDHDYVNRNVTDSAAAGTAMATGNKTVNGMIGVDSSGNSMESTSERAISVGKSAGVVSDVPFSHATPASWAAHNSDRNDYHGMSEEMIASDLDVIFGAGHPYFDDDNEAISTGDYGYISPVAYEQVSGGSTDFTYVEEPEQFEALAGGEVADEKYFGLAQVASTLHYERSGISELPGDVAKNNVADLSVMAEAALNILGQNDEGFHLMIEAGAIDWAGHANDSARDIEEVQELNKTVEMASAWVEENSSWDETLMVVTADHETGYLSGANDQSGFSAIHGPAGMLPSHGWYSSNHTNALVPVFLRGAGVDEIAATATNVDPVRGAYIDVTTIAGLTINNWWGNEG